jgi:hypothetical protein
MPEFLKPYEMWIAPLAGMMSGLAGLVVAILAYFRGNREVRQRREELETLKKTMAHTEESVASLKKQTATLQQMANSTEATNKEQATAFRSVAKLLEKLTKDSEERVAVSHNTLAATMDARFMAHEQSTRKMIVEILGQIHLDQQERAQSKLVMLRNQREMLESQQRIAEVQRDTIAHGMSDLRRGASPQDVQLHLKDHLDAELSKMPVDARTAAVIRTGFDQFDILVAPVLEPFFAAFGSLFNLGEDPREKERQDLEAKLRDRRDRLEGSISQLQARQKELAGEIAVLEKSAPGAVSALRTPG